MVHRYVVLKGQVPVLLFRDRPGALLSTAPRPPGFTPPAHSFVDAQALDAGSEAHLGALLASASSATQFIETLRAAGFEVREEPS